jgi:hypothetical protein
MIGDERNVASENGGEAIVKALDPSFEHRRPRQRMQHRLRDQSPVAERRPGMGQHAAGQPAVTGLDKARDHRFAFCNSFQHHQAG